MSELVHLRRGGTSLVLRLDDDRLPAVLHWGPDLGEGDLRDLGDAVATPYVDSVVMMPPSVAVLPQHAAGWLGRPGLLGSRDGRAWSTAFTTVEHTVTDGAVTSVGHDPESALDVSVDLELTVDGLVRVRAGVRNLAGPAYVVDRLEPALPVPDEAGELLDLTGRHNHERVPQRRPFDVGHWVREAWGGRPGHDSATVMCAGRPGFGFRSGRVWGVHLAHSGNQSLSAERSFTGWRLLRGGELLLPGEVRLEAGEEYWSPWLLGSWGEGLDDLSRRVHRYLRRRPQHPRSPRKALLNTWEAVHFDHDHDKLLALAEQAAAVGIERFVLDDGWFHARTADRAGLGDWYVDRARWPDGLHPLVDRVHELGMDFGLWVEPEMVNLDSELARAHPDWLLQTEHGPGPDSRQQQVLDLGHPEVHDRLLWQLSALVTEYRIAFLKWDHNRPLVDAGHTVTGRAGVHAQTAAVYRLMDELRLRHPGLEIESCSAGGARLDLGVLDRADRVWVSDCIDAHERHRMVRWTGVLLPPEVMGTHVGAAVDLTTARGHTLDFRAATAIWGHFGVEWDLTTVSPEELARLGVWVAFYREVRDLLHHGDVVRADLANPALQLDGVVAEDRRDALFRLSALDHSATRPPGRVPLPGLDPDTTYTVRAQAPGDVAVNGRTTGQVGWAGDGVRLTGRVLGTVGIQAPLLHVDESVLIRTTAT
ncbi:alpha-galactosidase [Nocardioides sp. Root1257]|uniref:alpha-galactosidase n=1 Tax=unclassified Nocardioides TaxID=2615069 RepID=UPI0006F8B5EB|nr:MULTISPECIES: alpha-galactosidase [unclassified Nocardioides]KQW47533.1 alpha-galactosidase [Nocardioides sp. Root1257]KRC45689.1 alpha-galactosidase [Nocardioides sp. Root224]